MQASPMRCCCILLLVWASTLIGCGGGNQGKQANGPQPAATANSQRAGIPATDAAIVQQQAKQAEVVQQGGQLEVKLNYAGKPVTDADLAKVPLNDAVTEIDLSNTQITDDGLVHLKQAKNLTGINLDNTKITDKGLEHLKELPNLQWVELMGNPQISTEAYDALLQVLLPRRPTP